MSVDTFDPGALQGGLDPATVADLCRAAARFDGENLDLTELEQRRFAPLVTHAGWAEHVEQFDDETLVQLIRLLTVGESACAGWQAGEKSAVIVLVRALKGRGAFDTDLSRWIKAHTDNKFLPHGSLMDRL